MSEKLEHYLGSIKERANNCGKLLDELNITLEQNKNLNPIEFAAYERALQVMIGSGTCLAKQWLKHLNKPIKSDAYSNFEELCSLQLISKDDLLLWKSVIGLRNALVHDYLEIDKEVVIQILQQQKHQRLIKFILNSINKLM